MTQDVTVDDCVEYVERLLDREQAETSDGIVMAIGRQCASMAFLAVKGGNASRFILQARELINSLKSSPPQFAVGSVKVEMDTDEHGVLQSYEYAGIVSLRQRLQGAGASRETVDRMMRLLDLAIMNKFVVDGGQPAGECVSTTVEGIGPMGVLHVHKALFDLRKELETVPPTGDPGPALTTAHVKLVRLLAQYIR